MTKNQALDILVEILNSVRLSTAQAFAASHALEKIKTLEEAAEKPEANVNPLPSKPAA